MANIAEFIKTAFATAKEVVIKAPSVEEETVTVIEPSLPQPVYKPSSQVLSLSFAILTGVFFKLYDDFSDLSILPDNHFLMEFFKVAITAFTTLMLLQDFYITVIFLILSIMELTLKSADTMFWRAGILIPAICFLLHLPHFVMPTPTFVLVLIALVALFLFIIYVEKITFPEETSTNKLINRAAIFAGGVLMLYNTGKYSGQPYIPLIGGWTAGYMGIYIITHLFELLTKNAPQPHEE